MLTLPWVEPVPINRDEQERVLTTMLDAIEREPIGVAMLLTWVLLGDARYVQYRLSKVLNVRRDYSGERG